MFFLIAVAAAKPAQDTGAGALACATVFVEDLLPPDGTQDVSPEAVPAAWISAECADGDVLAVLTGPADEVQTSVIHVSASGLIWFTELALSADGAWILDVQSGSGDATNFYAYGGLRSSFTTGSAGITPLEGTPALEILGSEFSASEGVATVSLEVHPIGGAGDPWQVLRGGAQLAASGAGGDTQVVDSVGAQAGDVLCYTLEQRTADGAIAATSEQVCETVQTDLAALCGCASTPDASGSALLIGLSALAWRRRDNRITERPAR